MMATNSKFKKIVSALVFLALCVVLLWAQYSGQTSSVALLTDANSLAANSAGIENLNVIDKKARKRLSSYPLDSAAMNTLYIATLKSGADDSAIRNIAVTMSKFGWRNTVIQQNLIQRAIVKNDLRSIIVRADALLRRMPENLDLLTLIQLVELDPAMRITLVERLGRNPTWKKDLLLETKNIALDPSQAAARGDTLRLMMKDKQTIPRVLLAPSLNAIIKAGLTKVAWDIYQLNIGNYAPKGKLIGDPNFIRLAEAANIDDYRPFPFDWTTYSDRGIQVDATNSIGDGALEISWDGRGLPLMITQYVNVVPGRPYILEVMGLDAKPELLHLLAFTLECEGQPKVWFATGIYNNETKKLVITSNGAPNCEFPRLSIRGRVQNVNKPHELSIKSIDLRSSV